MNALDRRDGAHHVVPHGLPMSELPVSGGDRRRHQSWHSIGTIDTNRRW